MGRQAAPGNSAEKYQRGRNKELGRPSKARSED